MPDSKLQANTTITPKLLKVETAMSKQQQHGYHRSASTLGNRTSGEREECILEWSHPGNDTTI